MGDLITIDIASLFEGRPDERLATDGRIGRALMEHGGCLLYTSPSPRDVEESRMPSSA